MTEEEKKKINQLACSSLRRERIKKFALTLLQQCKDENLSLVELKWVLEFIGEFSECVTLRDGLVL